MAFPVAPIVPMTVAEYAALPEDGEIHYELQEGVLVPMPSPTPEHRIASRRSCDRSMTRCPHLGQASVRTSVPSCPHRVWKLPSASVRR